MEPSALRRRLAVECGDRLAELHGTLIRQQVVAKLVELELPSLLDLRNRLFDIPRLEKREP